MVFRTGYSPILGFILCCLFLVLPSQVHGESGIKLKGIELVEGTLCPACGEDQTAIFEVKIRNTNEGFLACKEDIQITLEEIRACSPSGTCSILGLSRSDDLSSMTSGNLQFRIDEATTESVYFAVETGANTLGCDFLDMEVDVIVCDTGGGCVWDALDKPCEPPTAYRETVRIKALESTCPTSEVGTATLSGVVYGSDGDALRNARVELTRGCPGSSSHVKLDTRTESTSVGTRVLGSYEFTNIPQALGYTLEVTEDGQTNSQSIDITSNSVTQDITF